MQQGEDQGRIYPPILILKYGEITAKDIEADKVINISFSVDFYMDSIITYTIDVSNIMNSLYNFVVKWKRKRTL